VKVCEAEVQKLFPLVVVQARNDDYDYDDTPWVVTSELVIIVTCLGQNCSLMCCEAVL